MNVTAKRLTAYALAIIVVIVTILAVLAIWDIIELEDVMRKIMTSLLVVFASSVVTLFIFNVVVKEN